MQPISFISCPRCSFEQNNSEDRQCRLCGQPLQKVKDFTAVGIAVVGLLIAVGVAFTLRTLSSQGNMSLGTVQASLLSEQQSMPGPELYDTLSEVALVPAGSFRYGGSVTFAPLRSGRFVEALVRAHPEFRLRYVEPPNNQPGSGTGIAMLIDGKLDVAQSARPLRVAEHRQAKVRGFDLDTVTVGIDGVAFYTNPQLKLAGLSVSQLHDIFTGTATNWKQLGGPDLPIVPVSLDMSVGGENDFINRTVLKAKGLGKNTRIVRDVTTAIRQIQATPGAIGYASASEVVTQRLIRPIPIAQDSTRDYVSPFTADRTAVNRAAIKNGSYPVTHLLFVIVRRDGGLRERVGSSYSNLLLSIEGQQLIEQAGFVPIRF